jgi:hypothetical protein
MSVQVVRTDPLMLAVDSFLSEDEIATVIRHGSPLLSRSGIQEASAVEGTSSELRTSQVRNRTFAMPFYTRSDHFTKTGSGQA